MESLTWLSEKLGSMSCFELETDDRVESIHKLACSQRRLGHTARSHKLLERLQQVIARLLYEHVVVALERKYRIIWVTQVADAVNFSNFIHNSYSAAKFTLFHVNSQYFTLFHE
jgi:hypothetical protein